MLQQDYYTAVYTIGRSRFGALAQGDTYRVSLARDALIPDSADGKSTSVVVKVPRRRYSYWKPRIIL